MTKLLSTIVAAMFAAVSFSAIAAGEPIVASIAGWNVVSLATRNSIVAITA